MASYNPIGAEAFNGDEVAPFFGFLGAAAALIFACKVPRLPTFDPGTPKLIHPSFRSDLFLSFRASVVGLLSVSMELWQMATS